MRQHLLSEEPDLLVPVGSPELEHDVGAAGVAVLLDRLDAVGRARPDGFEFPLTQREMSECLGLTVVHVNRTLQELRRRNLLELENRQLKILDPRGLKGVAEFDPSYLYLDRRLR